MSSAEIKMHYYIHDTFPSETRTHAIENRKNYQHRAHYQKATAWIFLNSQAFICEKKLLISVLYWENRMSTICKWAWNSEINLLMD